MDPDGVDVFPIKNVPASYVSLPEGTFLQKKHTPFCELRKVTSLLGTGKKSPSTMQA